jgi:glycosyltransferase involved in cell wall biosynthesis
MHIVFLLESAGLWGGVKVILEDANGLVDRGHRVTVVCKSPPPDWMELRCSFVHAPRLTAAAIPDADVVIGTLWTTVPYAVTCERGVPVHFCQGYEGDFAESAPYRREIERIYALPIPKLVISPHLRDLIAARFALPTNTITHFVDHRTLFPGPTLTPRGRRLRVGLIGPYAVTGKDIRSGLRACAVLQAAGLPVEVVRASNRPRHPEECDSSVPTQWLGRVAPEAMGDVYRSLDVFLGTCCEAGEGFFLPAVEAMACGVPCVLTDIPCVRAYGPDEYARLVPAGDPIAMARAIIEVAGDARLRWQLREAGLQLASGMTHAKHLDGLEAALSAFAGLRSHRTCAAAIEQMA